MAPVHEPARIAARVDSALAHRGPDGDAWRLEDDRRLVLAHRRLAIIDPSPSAAQPMSTRDGRYTLVFNGEIYNHGDLRRSLEQGGARFATRSDSEVLLQLLVQEGPSALAKVRGMFACALWDAVERTLLVARDRFGIKPLYVTSQPRHVAFASEIRTLLESGWCERNIDPAGVLGFLRWGAIPGTMTWLRDVTSLEPGTWLRWSSDLSFAVGRFADVRALWSRREARPSSDRELRERARHAFEDSVRAHLVADVPVGCFLSGGIDSSALVAAAAAERSGLHTFTVVFDEPTTSEGEFARLVAEQFGTVHSTLRIDPRQILDRWTSIRTHMDQPTLDGINSYFVSGAVAGSGAKAVISGIGGDELFGGYPSFTRVPRGARLSALARGVRSVGSSLLRSTGTTWRTEKLQHAVQHADSTFELYRAVRGWSMPRELVSLVGPALNDAEVGDQVDAVEAGFAASEGDAGVHATVARLESTMYLRQQLLRDADVMSMAHGLELRVPFVDHDLIGSVWPALGEFPALLHGKALLVESSPRRLPEDIVSRPKQGFTLPFAQWLDGPLSDFVTDGLQAAARGGWIAPAAPAAVTASWKARACHWSRPWGLAVLGHFLDR